MRATGRRHATSWVETGEPPHPSAARMARRSRPLPRRGGEAEDGVPSAHCPALSAQSPVRADLASPPWGRSRRSRMRGSAGGVPRSGRQPPPSPRHGTRPNGRRALAYAVAPATSEGQRPQFAGRRVGVGVGARRTGVGVAGLPTGVGATVRRGAGAAVTVRVAPGLGSETTPARITASTVASGVGCWRGSRAAVAVLASLPQALIAIVARRASGSSRPARTGLNGLPAACIGERSRAPSR